MDERLEPVCARRTRTLERTQRPMDICRGQTQERLRAGPFEVALTHHPIGMVLPRHMHGAACAHFVLEGGYQETTSRGRATHGARTMLYKPAGEEHSNDFRAGAATCLRIEVATDERALDPRLGPLFARDPGLVELAARLEDELRRPDDVTALAAEGLCLELLARLGRTSGRGRPSSYRDLARRAAHLLEARYTEPVHFGDLAAELGTERTRLAHSFRKAKACTLGDYLRRLRVDHVRRALIDTKDSLAEIAAAAGFADQSHCTRTFRRVHGTTPGRYRQDARS